MKPRFFSTPMPSRHGPLEASTVIASLLPGAGEVGFPATCPLLGVSRFGGVFSYNPFELYATKVINSPNGFVFGQIGKGKSALVKSYVARMFACGFSSIIFDPKGEYEPLGTHFGFAEVDFITESRGVNPFINDLDGNRGIARELNRELGIGAIEFVCNRDLNELEEVAVSQALVDLEGSLDFARFHQRLIEIDLEGGPIGWVGSYEQGTLAPIIATIDVLLGANLVCRIGESRDLDSLFSQGILVINLSNLFGTRMYSLGVTLVLAAIRSHQMTSSSGPKVVAIDEIWALLADDRISRWLRSYWKLSRRLGIANLGVTHRLTDLGGMSAGNREMGAGLLADSETVVGFSMSKSEAEYFCKELDLAPEIANILVRLEQGTAVWKVGNRVVLIDHYLTELEKSLFDSDAAMSNNPINNASLLTVPVAD